MLSDILFWLLYSTSACISVITLMSENLNPDLVCWGALAFLYCQVQLALSGHLHF
jgi:hypothetical protein